jgi:hypothetical protein
MLQAPSHLAVSQGSSFFLFSPIRNVIKLFFLNHRLRRKISSRPWQVFFQSDLRFADKARNLFSLDDDKQRHDL